MLVSKRIWACVPFLLASWDSVALGCDWEGPCGSEVNVDPSGEGCVNPILGNESECSICHYIYNSPPCENTVENVYKNRDTLFADSPHRNDICGGPSGGDESLDEPWTDPEIQCGPICALSGRPSFKSIAMLDMCYRYTDNTCCYPIQDAEIADYYFSLLEAGDRCKDELIFPKLRLRDAFCLGCDPLQGKFLVEGKISVCSSLGNDILPWKFDECGLMMVAERGMPWYGDDTVIPSEAWPNVTGFLNDIVGAKPPYLDYYEVEVVDNCVSECKKTDGTACTIYDDEYLACAYVLDNISCYDPEIHLDAASLTNPQILSLALAAVGLCVA